MKNLYLKACLVTATLFGSASAGFAQPDCLGVNSVSWDLCIGMYTYPNGNRYLGEWKSGKRHGQGIEYFTNGAFSEGIYKNDIAQKRGKTSDSLETFLLKILFKNLSIKQRETIQLNLKKLGLYRSSIDGLYGKGTEGALTAFNSRVLDSTNLLKSENVTKLFSAVEGQKAEFPIKVQTKKTELQKCNMSSDVKTAKNCSENLNENDRNCIDISQLGIANGVGAHTYSDGSKYAGEFKNCKRQGQGIFIFGEASMFAGNKYVGEFRDDRYHGHGIFIFGTRSEFAGDKYFGQFKDDKKSGQGTYTYADGSKYAGEFKNDKKNGQGAYSRADGSKYIGEWKDGKANGKGTHTLVDGSKYVGEYKNGKPYGLSTKIWSNGATKNGTWIEGLFVFK